MIIRNTNLRLKSSLVAAGIAGFSFLSAQPVKHPNVILIITDDQGYGDLGINGNPHVKTPVLDNLARQSTRFNNFYVCPVSAPTRSGLMTGRYFLRTGVRDTYNGGAIMASDEVTIAEMLKKAGYATGSFGKWHLGDNYPFRPVDQGFDESVIHLTGGMGQPGDITTYLRGDSSYFDPVLWHNGQQEKYEGYCSDIFAREAVRFIENAHEQPFFCYLAFNAPHTPLQVPNEYYQIYKDIDPSKGFENDSRPFQNMSEKDKEDARKVYAMVTNIDDNIGFLLKKLDDLGITENTVVIFMTDNGPQQRRYNAGMRGLKGSVYRGGVRVPFYIRHPALGARGKEIEATAAYIDIMPTIADICKVQLPDDRKIDGISLLPLISGDKNNTDDRALFFSWTRHNPELYNNVALLKGKYKIVGHTDYNATADMFELFDIKKDPYEQDNIVKDYPEIATALKNEMNTIFMELVSSYNMINPPCIEVGTDHENPVILNRNDAGGERGVWDQEEVFGKWNLDIKEGYYNIRFRFLKPVPADGRMVIDARSIIYQLKNSEGNVVLVEMENVFLPGMKTDFIPFYEAGSRRIFPFWVEIKMAGN
jgi:arylsulfatase A-like enzyme